MAMDREFKVKNCRQRTKAYVKNVSKLAFFQLQALGHKHPARATIHQTALR